jgi:hypothetical protein
MLETVLTLVGGGRGCVTFGGGGRAHGAAC